MRGRTAPPHPRIYRVPPGYVTLGARDFTSAVSGDSREKPGGGAWASFGIDWYPQITIPWVPEVFLVASAYGRRCVGLRPTLNIPAAREKNLWYPGYRYVSIPVNSKRRPCPPRAKKNFGEIPRYVGNLDGQMLHQLALQRASSPPLTSDYFKMFQCLRKPFFQM